MDVVQLMMCIKEQNKQNKKISHCWQPRLLWQHFSLAVDSYQIAYNLGTLINTCRLVSVFDILI